MQVDTPCSPNTVNIQTNTTSSFAYHSTLLESVIDTFNRIVLHANKETRAKLRIWRSGIKKCRRSMSKVSLGHEMIGIDDTFDVFAMNANGDTHDHVLRSLSYSTIDSEQI